MNTFSDQSGKGKARKLQKEKTAKTILDSARETFEEVGFEKANIRDIAKRSGVAPGSVINHYKDKMNLLHSALYEDLETTIKKTFESMKQGNIEEKLSYLTKGVFNYYERRPKLSKILLKESLFAEEPWANKFAQQTSEVHHMIESICKEAQKNGEIKKEINSMIFSVSFLSFFYFALIAWVQEAYKSPVELVEKLTSEYIKSIKEGE
ncbi:MAG: TetR/AcrR family transcriptional regulator [Spirochaetia bacterium]|nr:TetR/AcrR family transcriptional regulator [Spirochaetia bacterium]